MIESDQPILPGPDPRTAVLEETGQINHFMAEASQTGVMPPAHDAPFPAPKQPRKLRPSGKPLAHGPTGLEVSDRLAAEEHMPLTPEQRLKNIDKAEAVRFALRRANAEGNLVALQESLADIEDPRARAAHEAAIIRTRAEKEAARQKAVADARAHLEQLDTPQV